MKKVRLNETEARQLSRIAQRHKTTESDVLREGLRSLMIIEDRKRNVGRLREFLTGHEPEEEPWEWPDRES